MSGLLVGEPQAVPGNLDLQGKASLVVLRGLGGGASEGVHVRVVVTGAAGFIGSAIVRGLLQSSKMLVSTSNTEVLAFDSLKRTGTWSSLKPVEQSPFLTLIQADIMDDSVLRPAMLNADVVIHCAAETSVDASFSRTYEFIRTNVAGTDSVITAAAWAGVGTFIHFSTDEVYGPVEHGYADEERSPQPTNPYSQSKLDSEMVVFRRAAGTKMRTVVVRPSNNYGPWQFPDNLIPKFVNLIVCGKKAPLYGTGEHRRCWVHVDDTVSAVSMLIRREESHGIFNIGGEELSNVQVVGHILRCLDRDWSSIEHVTDRLVNDVRYCNDESKLRDLGYMRQRDFTELIPEVVQHYRRLAALVC